MSDLNIIIQICQTIAEEGKQPSVALVKGKLPRPLPMPVVISGIKAWQNNPKIKTEDEVIVDKSSNLSPTTMHELERRIKTLEELVEKMQIQINDINH